MSKSEPQEVNIRIKVENCCGDQPATGKTGKSKTRLNMLSLTNVDMCKRGTALDVQLSGKTMKLIAFNYPKFGRMKQYTQTQLDAGVPFAPVDASGLKLADLTNITGIDQTDGTYDVSVTGLECGDDPVTVNFVFWWIYESLHSVHIVTEVISFEIPACSGIVDCPA